MAKLKSKDIKNMNKEEKAVKLKELKLELIKSRTNTSKSGLRPREIRKAIARILTTENNGDMSKMRLA